MSHLSRALLSAIPLPLMISTVLAAPAWATADADSDLYSKLIPVGTECTRYLDTIGYDEKRVLLETFRSCVKEKVWGTDTQFTETEQDRVGSRLGECAELAPRYRELEGTLAHAFASCVIAR